MAVYRVCVYGAALAVAVSAGCGVRTGRPASSWLPLAHPRRLSWGVWPPLQTSSSSHSCQSQCILEPPESWGGLSVGQSRCCWRETRPLEQPLPPVCVQRRCRGCRPVHAGAAVHRGQAWGCVCPRLTLRPHSLLHRPCPLRLCTEPPTQLGSLWCLDPGLRGPEPSAAGG